MVDEQQTTAAAGEGGKTTGYVVLAAEMVDRGDVGYEVWREVGVIDVPQRTTRATVVDRAGELVKHQAGEQGATVRLRVYPLDAHTEAEATLERPEPQLTVRVL
jgi:hypothetical protein